MTDQEFRCSRSRRITRRRFSHDAATTGAGVLAMPYLSRAADRPRSAMACNPATSAPMAAWCGRAPTGPSQMLVEVATTESFANARALAADRGAAGERLHREDAAGEPAGRAGYFLPRPISRPVAYRYFQRAGGRPLPHRARRPPRRQLRLGRRCRRTRLGHQSRRWRHGHLRHHAQAPPGFPAAFRRHHLCRWRHRRPRSSSPTARSGRTSPFPRRPRSPRRSTNSARAHKYNFLDDNVRAFNAEVPIFVQWDDHEVMNNWSSSKAASRRLQGARHQSLLAARAAQRFPRNVSDARKHR